MKECYFLMACLFSNMHAINTMYPQAEPFVIPCLMAAGVGDAHAVSYKQLAREVPPLRDLHNKDTYKIDERVYGLAFLFTKGIRCKIPYVPHVRSWKVFAQNCHYLPIYMMQELVDDLSQQQNTVLANMRERDMSRVLKICSSREEALVGYESVLLLKELLFRRKEVFFELTI